MQRDTGGGVILSRCGCLLRGRLCCGSRRWLSWLRWCLRLRLYCFGSLGCRNLCGTKRGCNGRSALLGQQSRTGNDETDRELLQFGHCEGSSMTLSPNGV